jgi:hypothetical protein
MSARLEVCRSWRPRIARIAFAVGERPRKVTWLFGAFRLRLRVEFPA